MRRDVYARRNLVLGLALASATIASAGGTEVAAPGAPAIRAGPAEDQPVVLFLGTSLTAGYGLAADQAYPAVVQQHIDAAGLDFRVVNAGVSGDTSAGGLRRLGWLLQLPIAVLVVELGANDMLRGLDVGALRDNLAEILRRTRAAHPDTRFVIAGMRRHKFNGWADVFLTTPADGLEDTYVYLGGDLPAGCKGKAVYHWFDPDEGSADYGEEIDAVISKKISDHADLLAKYAYYNGDEGVFDDRAKFWLQLTLSY